MGPGTNNGARDIIVVGASAGGVEALQRLAAGLPSNLPAALFFVLHRPAGYNSELAEVLTRSGPLPAKEAVSEEVFEHGRIYLAPPDYHMLLEGDRIQLWRGPKENRHRPAVNALFRSAAVAHGPRVIGVVLSGTLDDGTTGLWWIKRYGGLALVQHPESAAFPDMIYSALEHVEVDHIVKMEEMGGLIHTLVNGKRGRIGEVKRPNRAT